MNEKPTRGEITDTLDEIPTQHEDLELDQSHELIRYLLNLIIVQHDRLERTIAAIDICH